jgi:hypothetical protein
MSGEVAGRSPIEYLFFGVMDFICLLLAAESLNTLQYRRAGEWVVAGIASVLIGYYWPQIRLKIFRRSARQTEARKGVDKPLVEGGEESFPEPEPTLLSLLVSSFPRFHTIGYDLPLQFDDGTVLTVRAVLYYELTSNATFLGVQIPSSPETLSACVVLAKQAREIAEHLPQAGVLITSTALGENPQHVRNFTFTGKVYIHHVDRLTHEQMGHIENAFHAQKLEVVLRGPDFLTQAWIAWKQKGQPNITWDTISLQKLVFENGRFRRFVPYETAAFMFGIFIVVKNPPIKGQKVIAAGDVKARLLFKFKQGEYDISPGAWVDEPCSSVRLDVGDTRHLLLAVSQSYISDWKMIANRRASEGDAVSMDYTRDFPLLAEGTLEVNLLHVKSGAIIRTWETRVQWPKDYSLSFTGMKES